MKILGLSDSHDASAVYRKDDHIVCALSEERITRIKRQQGFPVRSIEYITNTFHVAHFDVIVLAGKRGRSIFRLCDSWYKHCKTSHRSLSWQARSASFLENHILSFPFVRTVDAWLSRSIIKHHLRRMGITYGKLILVDHHTAHLISALCMSSFAPAILLSMDAYGDQISTCVWSVDKNALTTVSSISYKHSIAQLYGYVHALLGYQEGDEGKTMALAEYGRETSLTSLWKSWFTISDNQIVCSKKNLLSSLSSSMKGYRHEDCAYAVQRTIEYVVLTFLRHLYTTVSSPDVHLRVAGGLFANVKLNQRIRESKLFTSVSVFPCMNDGGGAFAAAGISSQGIDPLHARSVTYSLYSGPSYGDEDIQKALNAHHLSYTYCNDIERRIAELIHANHIVARFSGAMEYGPRALGNRSILASPIDPNMPARINTLLARDQVMPFAPATLADYSDLCYHDIGHDKNLFYDMTTCVRCTEWMKQNAPAVVFIDGTARPQLVTRERNEALYRILHYYYTLSQNPSVLNTSFNMHGEPIVMSPDDAIRTFRCSRVDYLALGSFMVPQQ